MNWMKFERLVRRISRAGKSWRATLHRAGLYTYVFLWLGFAYVRMNQIVTGWRNIKGHKKFGTLHFTAPNCATAAGALWGRPSVQTSHCIRDSKMVFLPNEPHSPCAGSGSSVWGTPWGSSNRWLLQKLLGQLRWPLRWPRMGTWTRIARLPKVPEQQRREKNVEQVLIGQLC